MNSSQSLASNFLALEQYIKFYTVQSDSRISFFNPRNHASSRTVIYCVNSKTPITNIVSQLAGDNK
jgi:hypothetical protein